MLPAGRVLGLKEIAGTAESSTENLFPGMERAISTGAGDTTSSSLSFGDLIFANRTDRIADTAKTTIDAGCNNRHGMPSSRFFWGTYSDLIIG